jgi:predicted unusual protein kinase regulating ubiquinone biosynthesis (AarF/ABC1/UbiB family)
MEYMPGLCRISEAEAARGAGIDTDTIARRATEAYLMQAGGGGLAGPGIRGRGE